MNYKEYKVTGINPSSGRKRSVFMKVFGAAKPGELAVNNKLVVEALEVTEIPFDSPTEKQIAFAKSLDISIPRGACLDDVSCLIHKTLEHDFSPPNPGLVEFATNREMGFSKHIGKRALYNLVFNTLNLREKIAFFCFCVYRSNYGDRHANFDTSPNKDLYYEFAELYIEDKKFLNSFSKYSGQDIRYFGKYTVEGRTFTGASTKTIPYLRASSFLKDKSQQFKTPASLNKFTWFEYLIVTIVIFFFIFLIAYIN
ncbi:MAG: hypothetical protein LBP95_02885 [Deltaproteobacteria bacterium]|jgi:hypothetical protein|nr:hypothetical protein [Deltaproteobacteria bacterium]